MAVRGHDFLRLLPRISFQLTECHGCSTVNSVKQSSARTVLTGILVLSWLIEYWPERPEPDRWAVSLRRGTRISRRAGVHAFARGLWCASPPAFILCRMVERPCRTNPDLKHIWQWLLPDTPLPTCGTNRKDEDTCKDAAGADNLGPQTIDQR